MSEHTHTETCGDYRLHEDATIRAHLSTVYKMLADVMESTDTGGTWYAPIEVNLDSWCAFHLDCLILASVAALRSARVKAEDMRRLQAEPLLPGQRN